MEGLGWMEDFAKYAQYLKNPLVLVGFAIFLVIGTHRVLIQSGIIPKLSARSGSAVVKALLRYGFVMALAVIAGGFGLQYFKVYRDMEGNKELTQVLSRVYESENAGGPQVSYVRQVERLAATERSALQETIRDAEKILQDHGMEVTADNLVRLGTLYLAVGQYDKANATLLEAIKEDPKKNDAYVGLAMANQIEAGESMRKQEYERAAGLLEKAEGYAKLGLQDDPANSSLLLQMGYVQKELAQYYSDKGDLSHAESARAKAIDLFTKGIAFNPKDAGAHNGLGDMYSQAGDYDKAVREYETATQLIPEYTFAWYDLTITLQQKYQRNGKPDPDTMRSLLQALKKVYELQASDNAQKVPPEAWGSIEKIKDWALAEAGRLKKMQASKS
ncbi:MAG TPA: tetratricopeptide repeat protein [Candidatus Angelobacter sp.]|nr:tetratricopeptide repeat protein [Candidatus Angelobacter sp.]